MKIPGLLSIGGLRLGLALIGNQCLISLVHLQPGIMSSCECRAVILIIVRTSVVAHNKTGPINVNDALLSDQSERGKPDSVVSETTRNAQGGIMLHGASNEQHLAQAWND